MSRSGLAYAVQFLRAARPSLIIACGIVLTCTYVAPAMSAPSRLLAALPKPLAACAVATPSIPSRPAGRKSLYVTMPDGTPLAVDVWRPADALDARLPAMLVSTRYHRSNDAKEPSNEYQQWVSRGFAVVVLDVRGTGASFGQWYIPYSRQETEDVGHVARWIATQTWSNGRIATTGSSYPGTAALTAAAVGAPAIVASVPRFSDFDMYTDLLFPGDVAAENLIVTWGQGVRALDLDNEKPGVRPVDGADGPRLLAQALADHRKVEWGFDKAAEDVTFRDTPLPRFDGLMIDEAGTFNWQRRIEASHVPIFGWASWLDSGTAQGLLSRYTGWSNPQVSIIGAWGHGARYDADPFHPADYENDVPPALQYQLYSCFVEPYVMGKPTMPERSLIYYTMGEDRWKSTSIWPIPGADLRRYYFDANGYLTDRRPVVAARDRYTVDFAASTGAKNRWATQIDGADVDYGDRRGADKRLLAYTGPALDADTEITGNAVITLTMTSDNPDDNVFAYLEDVAPNGRVTYVTEGQLRSLHRKIASGHTPYPEPYPQHSFRRADAAPLVPSKVSTLTFRLMPTSVLFRAGHRIRIAIAGADAGNFRPTSHRPDRAIRWEIVRGGDSPSFVELPIAPRSPPIASRR